MSVIVCTYTISFAFHNNLVKKHVQRGNDLLRFTVSDRIGTDLDLYPFYRQGHRKVEASIHKIVTNFGYYDSC